MIHGMQVERSHQSEQVQVLPVYRVDAGPEPIAPLDDKG
jgi:hypothetical protein